MTQMLTPARHPLSGTSSTTQQVTREVDGDGRFSGLREEWRARRLEEERVTTFLPLVETHPLAGSTPGLTEMSAGGLLEYADGRLGDVDEQINMLFETMDGRRRASNEISATMEQIQTLQTAMNALGVDSDDQRRIDEITVVTPDGEMTAEAFIRQHDLAGALGLEAPLTDKKINLSQLESAVDALRSQQTQLNSRTEMDMLQMQQLVQQRSQVIELTTKLLEAMNQSQKAILQNLGR